MTKVKTEVTRQFEEIFEQHNDPFERERRRLIKNREEREQNNKDDKGLWLKRLNTN